MWMVHRMRSKAREAFEQMRGQQARQQAPRPSRKPGWSRPATEKPKKISDSEGTYVQFTEITEEYTHTTESATGDSTTSHTIVEQQITDVEWTEIKDD